jgi:HAE1 family hydrophobic/amphiphilic exporter-1
MTRFFVRHPVSTWMIFATFVVLGVYALPKLKIEAIPEVDLPSLTITTTWNGASPKAVQRSITLPVEEAVRRVHGVESVKSSSRFSRSQVEVSFRRGVDLDFAELELNEQLGAVRRNLPLGAGQPQVVAFVPREFRTEQFFTFSLESPLPTNELREEAEQWILPRVLAVEGVADAEVQGGARPLLKVVLDRKALELYDIRADRVFDVLDGLDELEGAGAVTRDGHELLVSLREPVDLERIRRAVVARQGRTLYRLGMLGEVREAFEDPLNMVRANGQNVVRIAVEKRSNANSVSVSRRLRSELPAIQASLPFAASFHVDHDEGKDLEEKLVELVYRSIIILAVLFVLLAVSLRQVRLTGIVIGSIIFALVISLSLFYFLRLSVNFITISGLTVCFGMLLDNSILVLDAIHRRLEGLHRADREGLSRRAKGKIVLETIMGGTREVAFPILATTLTTIVAFLSFVFLSGRLALYYVPLAVSVATAMSASLFVAFGWLPMVLHRGWAVGLVRRSADGPKEPSEEGELAPYVEERHDLETRPGLFERVIQLNQRIGWLILPATAAFIAWGFLHVYDKKVSKGGFWRLPDPEELFVYLEMPSGTEVEITSESLMDFEQALMPLPEGVRMTSMTYDNWGYIRVEFEDELLATEKPTLFRALWVEMADDKGGVSIFIRGFSDTPYFKGAFGGSALNSLVKLTGYNSKKLNEIAENTLSQIQKVRRVRNARLTSGRRYDRSSNEETVITFDRERLAEQGLTVAEAAGYLRRLIGVDIPWSMLVNGEQERVQMAFADADEIEFSDVASSVVTTPSGRKVRVGDIASIRTQPVSGSVEREDQRYTVFLNWEYIGTDGMRRAYIQSVLDGLDLPYGYAAEEAQQEFFTQEEEEDLVLMVVLAVIFIYMLMAALFESLTLPMVILLSLPMALVGVFITFWLYGAQFDSSARIGLVLLFGIVVNNAILLVSRIRTEASLILKERLGGQPESEAAMFPGFRRQLGGGDLRRLDPAERAPLLRRAVARATRIRLRSILLTSGTTIVGLVPLLVKFRETEGQDIWENLALSSIGGLVSSTVLILLAMPPLYYAGIRAQWLARRFGSWIRARFSRRTHPEPELVSS